MSRSRSSLLAVCSSLLIALALLGFAPKAFADDASSNSPTVVADAAVLVEDADAANRSACVEDDSGNAEQGGDALSDGTSMDDASDEEGSSGADVADVEEASGAPIADDLVDSVDVDTPGSPTAAEVTGADGAVVTESVSAHATTELVTAADNALADGVYAIASALSNAVRVEIGGASTSNGAATQVYADNATPAQRWRFSQLGSGLYKIVNVATGKVLDVAGASIYNGARVQQYADNGTKAQQWAVQKTSDGYMLTSALSSAYVLDLSAANTSNGTRVQLYESNGTKAQRWNLIACNAIVPEGLYEATCKASDKDLDVSGGSIYNAANVQQYAGNGTLAQRFYFKYDETDGYYAVLAAASGLALDVSGAADWDGANVQLYEPNNTRAQKWAVSKNSDGTYTLRSAVGGRALDVSGASRADGANVQTWASNSTDAQRFRLASAGAWSIPEGVYNIVLAVNQANSLSIAGDLQGSGANAQTAPTALSSWAQKWAITEAGGGYYRLRNLNSRMALAIVSESATSGANVGQSEAGSSATQLWKAELTVGGIVFRSKADGGIVLDINGASTNVGANVQVYASNATKAQKFRIREVGVIDAGKTFVANNVGANKVLDIWGASQDNGAALQLYEANNTVAQKFRITSAGNSAYYLQNISSQKYAEVDPATKTKLQQWEKRSDTSGRWRLAFDLETCTFTIKSVLTNTYLDGTAGTLALAPASGGDYQRFELKPIVFKLYLDAGHGWGSSYAGQFDSGATGNGYQEADLTADLTDRILKICIGEFGLDVVDGKVFQNHYAQRTHKAEELGCTALLSIHFNATGTERKGSGYMSIVGGAYKRNPNSMVLTEIMHEHLGEAMRGLYSYGISERDDLAIPNNSNMPATLLEVCFIDNEKDVKFYDARRDYVARCLAEGVLELSMRGEFN